MIASSSLSLAQVLAFSDTLAASFLEWRKMIETRNLGRYKDHSNMPLKAIFEVLSEIRAAMRGRFRFFLAFAWVLIPELVLAHHSSDAFLFLHREDNNIGFRIDIALRDLEEAVGLDIDRDARITWAEVNFQREFILRYLSARLRLSIGGEQKSLNEAALLIDRHSDGRYLVFRYVFTAPEKLPCQIEYHILSERDPQHRGLLEYSTGSSKTLSILSPEHPSVQLDPEMPVALSPFHSLLREGIWHIWLGYDHVLFLLSLLLGAVMLRERGSPVARPVQSFSAAFWKIFGIVTAFTISHTLSLAAATLGLVHPTSWIVESAIAASVAIAALNNLIPLFYREYFLTFFFGLIHGLGFASVLAELQLSPALLVQGLLGFNLGVECGQLAIVLLVMPLAYLLRNTRFYRQVVLKGGSALIVLIALVWIFERVFEVKVLGF